jgi:hypothetical protein
MIFEIDPENIDIPPLKLEIDAYVENGYAKYDEDIYLLLEDSWNHYPFLMVGHNLITYYIPLNISSKKINVIREGYSEYGKIKRDYSEVTAEITSIDKSDEVNSCTIKGQTKSSGKFYYTEEGFKSKYLEYFICFDSEEDAQKNGYTKSFSN